MLCQYCKKDYDESNMQLHHIIPKSIGGDDTTRMWLCIKCHHIIHNMLPKLIWQYVNDKEKCKEFLINYFENIKRR